MKIVINSHINSTNAITHFMESLQALELFNEFEYIICIGGYYELPDYEVNKEGNITYIKCNNNSIDYTSLIALYDLYYDNVNEYYFYVHDTCRAGPNFLKKIKELFAFITTSDIQSMRIVNRYSMNIGFYSQKLINNNKDIIFRYKNTSPELELKCKKAQLEDMVFDNDPTNKVIDNLSFFNIYDPHRIATNYYGNGVKRIVEYYYNIDLYKIKANHSGVVEYLDN
jgi:hypothetical protein